MTSNLASDEIAEHAMQLRHDTQQLVHKRAVNKGINTDVIIDICKNASQVPCN